MGNLKKLLLLKIGKTHVAKSDYSWAKLGCFSVVCRLTAFRLLHMGGERVSASNVTPTLRIFNMFKYTLSLVAVAVFAIPAFADCGCNVAPTCGCDAVVAAPVAPSCGCEVAAPSCGCEKAPKCKRPRTRLKLATVNKTVCRPSIECTVDCCGCPKRSLVWKEKCVKRFTLVKVAVERKPRCPKPAPSCGCDVVVAPTCGCETVVAAPTCGSDAVVAPSCGCK